jgi:O-antigen/teichoic acid export membrane protein
MDEEKSKPSSSFVSNVMSLASGSVFAQGLAILAAPVLARLFDPDTFGLAALFASFSSIIVAVSTLRYEMAIMLPKADKDAANIVGLCAILVVGISIFTAIIFEFSGNRILYWLNGSAIAPYIGLLSLSVLLLGLAPPLRYWFSRKKRFKELAVVRVVTSASNAAFCLGGGVLGYIGAGNLIFFRVLGGGTQTVSLLWLLRKEARFFITAINPSKMLKLAKRYIKFPLLDTWLILLSTVSQQLPVLLLMRFFGATTVGLYSHAIILLFIPLTFLGEAIAQVLFQSTAEKHAAGEKVDLLVETVFKGLVSIAMLPFFLLIIVSPELFAFALGERWTESGVYAALLAPLLLTRFLASPLSILFSVFERQGTMVLLNLMGFILRTGALLLGGYVLSDPRSTVSLFGLAGAFMYTAVCGFSLSLVDVPYLKMLRYVIQYACFAVPCVLLIAFAKWIINVGNFTLLLVAVFSSFLYFFVLFRKTPELHTLLIRSDKSG